jgi:NitT/TauT family transport system substrate-binding protein
VGRAAAFRLSLRAGRVRSEEPEHRPGARRRNRAADKWIAKAGATDVAKVVPESYLLGDSALYLFSFNKVKEAISPDGLISDAGARATLKALAAFDTEIHPAEINLAQTYTNEFSRQANQKYK